MAVINYRLPLSAVEISGTETTKQDSVLERSDTEQVGAATLTVGADPRGPLALQLDAGDATASFALTEDGRLTSSSWTVTGQGGALVSGLVGIAATVLSVGIGRMAVGASRLRPESAAVEDGRPEPESEAPEKPSDDDRIESAYETEKAAEAALRRDARTLVASLRTAYFAALRAVPAAAEGDARAAAVRDVARLDTALARAQVVLDQAEALFEAWRARKITSTTQALTYRITLDELRLSDVRVDGDGEVIYPDPGGPAVEKAQAKVRIAWDRLGVLVVVQDDPPDEEPAAPSIGKAEPAGLTIRFPRPVILAFYRKEPIKDGTTGARPRAVLEALVPAMVVDGLSRTQRMEVTAGWFGKEGGKVTFSSDGIPIGFEFTTTSEVTGAVTALAGIPGIVATSLETTAKIANQLDLLHNRGAEQELARAKRETDLLQQQLTKKGLAATETDFAKVERLKQEVAIHEQMKTLGRIPAASDPVAEEIASLKRQVELLRLQRQVERLSD